MQQKHVKIANQGTFSFLSVAVAHMMLAKASRAASKSAAEAVCLRIKPVAGIRPRATPHWEE